MLMGSGNLSTRHFLLYEFFDLSTPSMRKVGDGEEKKKKEKRKRKEKREKENNDVYSGH